MKPPKHPNCTGKKVAPTEALLYTFMRCPKFKIDRRIINCITCAKSNPTCSRGQEISKEFKEPTP